MRAVVCAYTIRQRIRIYISCKNETEARHVAGKRTAIDIKLNRETAVSALYKTSRSVCTVLRFLRGTRRALGRPEVSYRGSPGGIYTVLAREARRLDFDISSLSAIREGLIYLCEELYSIMYDSYI